MDYVKLGSSDLRVSRICLGCMGFGDPTIGQHSWTIGEEPTRDIIRRSLDLGVGRPLWCGDDADLAGLAVDQGRIAHRGSHQTASHRGSREVTRCPSDCR